MFRVAVPGDNVSPGTATGEALQTAWAVEQIFSPPLSMMQASNWLVPVELPVHCENASPVASVLSGASHIPAFGPEIT